MRPPAVCALCVCIVCGPLCYDGGRSKPRALRTCPPCAGTAAAMPRPARPHCRDRARCARRLTTRSRGTLSSRASSASSSPLVSTSCYSPPPSRWRSVSRCAGCLVA
eukprot:6033855-Prymnesium_polylepis.1